MTPAQRMLGALRQLLCLSALLGASAGWAGHGADALPVRVCFDADSNSAHRFRDAQGRPRGAAFELVEAAFQRAGLQVLWLPLPWMRCQREVMDFEGANAPEVLFFASRSSERDRALLATRALHRDLGGVWYSRRALPKGPVLRRNADLAGYTLCGKHGGNFEWLAAHGVPQPQARPLTLRAALAMVERGHCQLFLLAEGPVQGAAKLGQLKLTNTLAFAPFPQEAEVTQHLMVARGSARAELLREHLDAALLGLHQSGEADRIYQRYTGLGTGLPR